MLSDELEFCLNSAFHQAREARHEYLTVERLLLVLLDTPMVGEVLRACGADSIKITQELKDYIEHSTPRRKEDDECEVQPTISFQRVLQRAVYHSQSSGEKEVGVGNVLVAIYSEKQSHAVSLLNQHQVTRISAVSYTSQGLAKFASERADDDNEENGAEFGKSKLGWHLERFGNLLAKMSEADIEMLWRRAEHDAKSLSVDDMGVLFLVLRERILTLDARLKNDSGTGHK